MKNTFLVAPEKDNERLDKLLVELLAISRSQVQKLIDDELVTINGKTPKKAGDRVRPGNKIVVSSAKKAKAVPVGELGAKAQKEQIPDPTIVAETSDYVVLIKPRGMLVHPTMANEKNTLVSWLVKKYPGIKKVGDDTAVRPGIVHRLDKEASGLMVVARTQKMFDLLKEQFKNRAVEKEYLALVHGRVEKNWDEIKFPIARSETTDRMAARPLLESKNVGAKPAKASALARAEKLSPTKEAHTEFIVEQGFVNCTLLRVILHTGRMHQIRVHFLAYNHPLVGDPLYNQKKRKDNLDQALGRLFLHSVKLGFNDLSGERQVYETELPVELKNFLATLPKA